MALYLIEYLYNRPPERRHAATTEHVAYLRRLALDGIVLAAGAIRNTGHGFVLVAADSSDQAAEVASCDPIIIRGGASVLAPMEWLVDIASTDVPALLSIRPQSETDDAAQLRIASSAHELIRSGKGDQR
jgi:uncharacterized protein YciI